MLILSAFNFPPFLLQRKALHLMNKGLTVLHKFPLSCENQNFYQTMLIQDNLWPRRGSFLLVNVMVFDDKTLGIAGF